MKYAVHGHSGAIHIATLTYTPMMNCNVSILENLSPESLPSISFCTNCFILYCTENENCDCNLSRHVLGRRQITININDNYTNMAVFWQSDLNRVMELDPYFFKKDRHSPSSLPPNTIPLFAPFPVTPSNNADIHYICISYNTCDINATRFPFSAIFNSATSGNSHFQHLRGTIGQFVRWMIIENVLLAEYGWIPGCLFTSLAEKSLVQQLIELLRSIGVTDPVVCDKARHLQRTILVAFNYFQSNIQQKSGLLDTFLYLQSTFTSEESENDSSN